MIAVGKVTDSEGQGNGEMRKKLVCLPIKACQEHVPVYQCPREKATGLRARLVWSCRLGLHLVEVQVSRAKPFIDQTAYRQQTLISHSSGRLTLGVSMAGSQLQSTIFFCVCGTGV
jgi:hypothetical protein